MAQQKIGKIPGSSSSDELYDMLVAYKNMSPEERKAYFRRTAEEAKKIEMTDDDYTLLMAADGYFQNQDGQIE